MIILTSYLFNDENASPIAIFLESYWPLHEQTDKENTCIREIIDYWRVLNIKPRMNRRVIIFLEKSIFMLLLFLPVQINSYNSPIPFLFHINKKINVISTYMT